jgi:hypothetical protein
MKAFRIRASVLAICLPTALAGAAAQEAGTLPLDTPMTMRAVEAVCTGIGSDSRTDPRWGAYPLRIELAGRGGQFLGDAQVSVIKDGEDVASVGCGGPWVLFKLAPGAYTISAEVEGTTRTAKVSVGTKNQTRVVLRFPESGGAISPEYVPPK